MAKTICQENYVAGYIQCLREKISIHYLTAMNKTRTKAYDVVSISDFDVVENLGEWYTDPIVFKEMMAEHNLTLEEIF